MRELDDLDAFALIPLLISLEKEFSSRLTVMRMNHLLTSLLLACLTLAPGLNAAENELSDADIKAILRERVEDANKAVGIVVGLVDEHATRIIAHGTIFPNTRDPV